MGVNKQNIIGVDNSEINNNSKIVEDDDFIFYKENGKIMSGGFNVESILLKKNLSPISTYNYNNIQTSNVSDLFKNLTIPSGLYFFEQKSIPCDGYKYDDNSDDNNEEVIENSLYDKLLSLYTVDNINKFKENKKSSRKKRGTTNKNKSKKNLK